MFVKKVKSMTTFKEFLLSRNVINEDIDKDWEDAKNDPRNKALEEFQKTEGAPTGLNSDDEEDALIKINDIVADKGGEEFESWEKVIEAWEKYNNKKKAYDTDNGDISDVEDDEKAGYIISALKNRMGEAVKFNDETAASVAKALIDADDGNGKIVKKEFLDAIKNIKGKVNDTSIGNKLNNLAALLYFVYLTKTMKGVKGANIITKDGLINGRNLDKHGIDSNALKDLNKRLGHFKKLNFDSDILSIFKTPKATIALMNSIKPGEEIDETQFDKIKDKFVLKRTETKQAEKEADKRVNDAKIDLEKTQNDIDELKQKKEELLKGTPTGREEAVSKKKFYIFDIDMPDPKDELDDWFEKKMKNSDYAGGAMGMIAKIEAELGSYAPKSNENDLNEMVAKIFEKNGVIFENYEKTNNKVVKKIEKAKNRIRKLLDDAQVNAKSLQAKIEANSSFTATVELRRRFKQVFINLGYELSREIQGLVQDTNVKMDKLRSAKVKESIKNYKTTDQLGQEEMDADHIVKIMDGNGLVKDEQQIARFMLINLISKSNSSDEVLDYLNSKNFGANKNDDGRAYVYSGTSRMIYALSKKDVTKTPKGEITIYNFDRVRARVYRKPADLLKDAVGIDVSKLTPGVIKRAKKEITDGNKEVAENYLKTANDIADKIREFSKSTSVVSEGIMDFLTKQKNVTDDKDFKELSAVLEKYSHKIDLGDINPEGDAPESVALRQILKGACLIVTKSGKYVTTHDALSAMEQNETPQQQNTQQQQQNAQQSQSKLNSKDVDTTTGSNIDWNNWDYSVVTSGNADSTYGDGYGYNKKADAIKKKLNSTTYTYMPNSKMRIVRRTFD